MADLLVGLRRGIALSGKSEETGFMKATYPWQRAPEHRLSEAGVFMVTASTYLKKPHFTGEGRLEALTKGLLKYSAKHGWKMQAWAVFPNHYHFVAVAPKWGATGLRDLIREMHSRSARWVNREDGVEERKVWHNYWDRQIRTEAGYLARLNYVHQNAVKHGLVMVARDYPWCSASWFESTAPVVWRRMVESHTMSKIKEDDEL